MTTYQMPVRCPACRHGNPPDSRFCRACGFPVAGATVTSRPGEGTRVEHRDQRRQASPGAARTKSAPAQRRWLPVVAIVVLLAIAGGTAAVMIAARPRGSHNETTDARKAAWPAPKLANGRPQAASPTPSPTASSTATSAPYNEGAYLASPPTGWPIVENAKQMPGYVESKWHSPSDSHELVKVDVSPASGLSPAASAAPIHADLLREPGYKEVKFAPDSLRQVPSSLEWVFEVPGSERIDWFFSDCGHDFAVLGAAGPREFASLLPTFRSFAESVRGACNS